jgi:hypothetical protein
VIATPFAKTLKTLHWDTLANGLVVAGTLLFLLVAWFNKEVLGDDSQRPWVRARQVGEGLKSLSYRLVTGAQPYDGIEGLQRALDQAHELVTKAGIQADAATQAERAEKIPAVPLPIADYVLGRLDGQVTFYEDAAEREKAVVQATISAQRAISLALVVFGALGAVAEWRDIWAPALGLASTTIAAQMTLTRRRFLVDTYSTAAVKLRFAKTRWSISDRGPDDDARLVASVEGTLNGENAGWVEQMLLKPMASDAVPTAASAHDKGSGPGSASASALT